MPVPSTASMRGRAAEIERRRVIYEWTRLKMELDRMALHAATAQNDGEHEHADEEEHGRSNDRSSNAGEEHEDTRHAGAGLAGAAGRDIPANYTLASWNPSWATALLVLEMASFLEMLASLVADVSLFARDVVALIPPAYAEALARVASVAFWCSFVASIIGVVLVIRIVVGWFRGGVRQRGGRRRTRGEREMRERWAHLAQF
ncbi:hypothetical protein NpNSSI1_00011746 [Neofusicoccum parvum]|nr:hypothetical protein NpNSSI1_00011746 [Neofusicoccum parvum]